jgi:tRNA dimethylallyltransferase
MYGLAVESVKRSTRKYAKRQVSWIKNKLIPAVLTVNERSQAGPITPFYLLDATGRNMFLYSDPQSDARRAELGNAWDDNVLRVADKITRGECGCAINRLKWLKDSRFSR